MNSVLIVGTGRVAFHLSHALARAGNAPLGIVGRNEQKVLRLAEDLGIAGFAFGDTLPSCEAIILAVNDDAIAEVARGWHSSTEVLIHTSGASSLDLLAPHMDRATLWPIMTLSPGMPADFTTIPIVTDANTERARSVVNPLARSISPQVVELPHGKRELLHAAAAISTNFPLFLLAEAQRLLEADHIDPSLLLPSFTAMAAKATLIGAHDALTGPARRGDIVTIQHHLSRLEADGDLHRAYALLSAMILKAQGHSTDGLPNL